MKNFKDSGIEWLGEIPEHWEVVKIKHIFNIGRGRVISQEELDENGNFPVYSSQTTNNGILGYIKTYDFDCEQITWTTDGVNAGTIFLRNGKYNCTNVCGILKPRNNENMSFLTYALQNVAPYYKRPDTNGAKIMNNEMANIQIIYPPLKEQEQIVNFLDEKCEQIANFIEKKEKLISLLKEQKQALLNETITKGLNKNVNFKDSGIEWLGEIPQHWGINKLKFIAYVKGRIGFHGLNSKEFQYSKGAHLVTGNDFDNNEVAWDRCRRINEERFYEDPNIHLQNNDLLVTKDGTIGKTAIVRNCPNQATLNSGIFLVRVMEKLCLVKYLFYIINSQYFKEFVISKTCGSTIKHLYQSDFHEFKIPLPPLKEQEQIANFLDKKCEKIDLLIEKTKKQIELIKEYKTTLINQAVCGKISL
ncbi:TPA: restriction endonuclease subunit S [Campylobacter jejuni]|nr:restriction endonuclease subunit S [Campylobacter jejuni]HDZ5091208.1 restriction endonuclease subunit S [Campylobacter jejuni]HDZ5096844.1 restriction endonuclease subunit S [Campylobacter jejuni]HDZ5099644.1 restriction endonuclease subunit S [Campylobacter jejuni]